MRTLLPVLMALLAAMLLTACGSAEDRSARYLERAQAFYDEGDFVKARLDLRTAVKIDRENIEARMLLARIAERNRNYPAMSDHLKRVLVIDENYVEARVKLGVLMLGIAGEAPAESEQKAQAIAQAREHLAVALAQAPQDPDAQVLEASLKRYDGDVAGATEQARSLVAAHPDNVPAHSLLFSLLYQQQQAEQALVALDEGIELNPSSAALHLLRLQAFRSLERWDDVESGLQRLIEQFPDENSARYQLAAFYAQRDRDDDAQAVLEALIADHPDDSTAKLEYAEFLANNRDLAKAEEELRKFIADEPEIQEYRFALATLYQAQDRRGDAISTFEAIVGQAEDVEDRSKARNELAKLYLREDRVDEAQDLIAAVLEDSAEDPEALILRAGLALQAGETEQAITDLRSARRNAPDSRRALTLLSRAHLQAGDDVLAEDRLRDLVAAHPGDTFGRDQLATLLFSRQQYRDVYTLIRAAERANAAPTPASVRLLVESLIRDGRADEALSVAQDEVVTAGADDLDRARLGHYLAGRAQRGSRQYEGALNSYREAAALGPMTADLLSGLVSTLVDLDRPDEAISELDAYLEDSPDDFAALTLKGQVLSRGGRLEEARTVLERSLEVRGDVWPTYRDLISVNVTLNDVDRALEVADRGLAVAPDNLQLRLIRAQLLERQAAYGPAMDEYEAILSADPSSLIALNNLASLIADHDVTPERLREARDLVRPLRSQSNPIFMDTIGWLHYRLEEYEEARSFLERAVSAASGDQRFAQPLPQLRYHLGMTYVALAESELARRELEAAIAEDGVSFVGVQEARATLSRL